jgi:O-antigen ligase
MVVAFAAGSSSAPWAVSIGRPGRWVALVLVLVLASVAAATQPGKPRPSPGALASAGLVAAFGGIALASAFWSVAPRLSFERAGSFCLLILAAAAVALAVAGDRRGLEAALGGIVAGAGVVALLGLVLLVVAYDQAVMPADATWRFRGFGLNPNTVPMLFALALPPAVWLAFAARSRRLRLASALIGAMMYVEIVLSGSRGAIVAAFVAFLIPLAVLVRGRRRKALAGVALVAALFGGFTVRVTATPPSPAVALTPTQLAGVPVGAVPRAGGPPSVSALGETGICRGDLACLRVLHDTARRFPDFRGPLRSRPEDEIGQWIFNDTVTTRGSGRVAAWQGALSQVGIRPLLGYGFGTEASVFVDRWYYFQGALPENSYLGVLLQVGGIGLILLALGVGLALLAGVVVLRRGENEWRAPVAVLLSVVVAGLALMLVQSYSYSVGNIATSSLWLSVFLLLAAASAGSLRAAQARAHLGRRVAVVSLALLVAAAATVGLGRWERARYVTRETTEMRALFDAVGGQIAGRTLTSYRPGPPDCLWYQVGSHPYGISLCFDGEGRLVEASDRRSSGAPVYWRMVPPAAYAHTRVDPAALRSLFHRLDAIERVLQL